MKADVVRFNLSKKVHIESEFLREIYAMDNLCLFDGDKMIGRALIIPVGENKVLLLDIYIYDPNDRNLGYGSMLMEFITRQYDYVMTGWISHAGRDLCLKHGFTLVKGMFAKNKDVLIYEKGVTDGSSKEDRSAEAAGSQDAQPEGGEGRVEDGSAEVHQEG